MKNSTSYSVSIMAPIGDNTTDAIKNAISELNPIVVRHGKIKEFCFKQARYELKNFESFLTLNKIPYDLYEYASDFGTPKVKKFRPAQNFCKQIACLMYTGSDDGDEDGLLTVSSIQEIINNSTTENLRDNLQKALNNMSFKHDVIEDLYDLS